MSALFRLAGSGAFSVGLTCQSVQGDEGPRYYPYRIPGNKVLRTPLPQAGVLGDLFWLGPLPPGLEYFPFFTVSASILTPPR